MAVYRPVVRASDGIAGASSALPTCRLDAFVVPPTVTPQPTVRGVLRELGPPNATATTKASDATTDGHRQTLRLH